MGKRRAKRIGRLPKHSKVKSSLQAVKPELHVNYPTSTQILLEHNYASKSEPSLLPTNDSTCESSCGYTGSFELCSCIVHFNDGTNCQTTVSDLSKYDADENYAILGASAFRFETDEEFNKLTLQGLRDDCIKNERQLSDLNINLVKTTEKLFLSQFYENKSIRLKTVVTVGDQLQPSITVHNKDIPLSHPVYMNTRHVFTFSDLVILIKSIQQYGVCTGNPDENYIENFSGKTMAYIEGDYGASYISTIRTNKCQLLTLGARCKSCITYRDTLRSKENRKKRRSTTQENILTSSKPNKYMTRDELESKLSQMKTQNKCMTTQLKRLKVRNCLMEEQFQAQLSAEEAEEINNLVQQGTSRVQNIFPDETCFQRIFWEEQVKYNELKSKSSMRWHPLIVKWALLIKSKSSKAYEAMKDSGFINLPSERTLYDYSHCVNSELGFSPGAISMLAKECKQKGMFNEPWRSYVGLLQDEIKVKDDLIYDPTSGKLIGYTHLDNVSNQIMELEGKMNNKNSELASSALVVMVRGATTDLKFPLAAFATKGLNACQLYSIIWRTVELLELDIGLKVLFVTCDGAGQNRRFFDMHSDGPKTTPVHYCKNPYAEDDRPLYFISDVPHLLKTARNCFANSASHKNTRRLWNNGQEILWMHIVDLYKDHIENNLFTKVKLTRSHIDLTSFNLMKVSLAAQVFSNHVAAALEEEYGDKVKETVKFIRHMNKFFDCLNTRNLYEARDTINPDMAAYTDSRDPRLDYLENDFLQYFEEWDQSVENRPGQITREHKEKMKLSQQTIRGIQISVKSIVGCVKHLLQQGAPFVLTARFNQDVLEQHFGHYRHKGGACDNPTIYDIRHTMNTLRVVGSSALAPLRGNTKRMKSEDRDNLINVPLPRKKSRCNNKKE